MTGFWMDAGLVGLWVATVFQILFVVFFGTRPWWRDFVGRAIFSKSAALGVILASTVVNHYLTYRFQLQVSVVLMWLVAVTIVWQFVALLRQWRAARTEAAAGARSSPAE